MNQSRSHAYRLKLLKLIMPDIPEGPLARAAAQSWAYERNDSVLRWFWEDVVAACLTLRMRPSLEDQVLKLLQEDHDPRPVVFVCSPYAGDVETNTENAKAIGRWVATQLGKVPLVPHLMLPRFLDDGSPDEREMGLEMSRALLERCDELLWYAPGGQPSDGMEQEIDHARSLGMPIKRLGALPKWGDPVIHEG